MSFVREAASILEKRQPELAQRLIGSGSNDQGTWVLARNGSAIARRGTSELASSYHPEVDAERALPRWEVEPTFVVAPGLGLAYHLEAFVRRWPHAILVVVEPSLEWLHEVLLHRNLVSLFGLQNIHWVVGEGWDSVESFLDSLDCRGAVFWPWRAQLQADRAWCDRLDQVVRDAVTRAWVNRKTMDRFWPVWKRNWEKNRSLLKSVVPVSALAGVWSDRPVVICAAGPSLAASFPWIEKHRGQVALVVVDTAWTAVRARGLIPDVVVVVDGQYWNSRHLDHKLPSETWVVTESTGPRRAFELAQGRTAVAQSSLPLLAQLEKIRWGVWGKLPSGGSVATAAWSLARLSGSKTILFAGLDLGYPRGQTHVPGSLFEELAHQTSGRLRPVETAALVPRIKDGWSVRPGILGDWIPSDPRMDVFRHWLERQFSQCNNTQILNLASRGTLIAGMSNVDDSFAPDWPDVDAWYPQPILSQHCDVDLDAPPWALWTEFLDQKTSENYCRARRASVEFWGDEVWCSWAGRYEATWNRFPSPGAWEALVDLGRRTLRWQAFWELGDET